MSTTNSFALRRAYLRLSEEEHNKISGPIAARCNAVLAAGLALLSILVALAAYLTFASNDRLREGFQSLQIGLSFFMLLAALFIVSNASRCLARYILAATYRQFSQRWPNRSEP
jgi:hypothetical protein